MYKVTDIITDMGHWKRFKQIFKLTLKYLTHFQLKIHDQHTFENVDNFFISVIMNGKIINLR